MLLVILAVVVVVPICWLVSEFQDRRWLRILLGIVGLGMSYFVAFVVGGLSQLNYNAHYGTASADLIETVIANIEEGNHAELVIELKRLRNDFQPTYENRANYDGLINEFVDRMEARESDNDSEVASDSPPS